MKLYARVEQVIKKLRPAFSREVPFEWFVLLLWGALLSHQPAAVTSYLNGVGLGEASYGGAHYQCFELYWDCPDTLVLFVLTQLPNGKQIILLSSENHPLAKEYEPG